MDHTSFVAGMAAYTLEGDLGDDFLRNNKEYRYQIDVVVADNTMGDATFVR